MSASHGPRGTYGWTGHVCPYHREPRYEREHLCAMGGRAWCWECAHWVTPVPVHPPERQTWFSTSTGEYSSCEDDRPRVRRWEGEVDDET